MGDFRPDPRGFSSERGMRLLSDHTLRAMTRGNAGEGHNVIKLAAAELERRKRIGAIEADESALSPYEQELYRSKGLPMEKRADGLIHSVRITRDTPKLSRQERRRLFLASKSENKAERAAAMHALSPPDPE